MLSTRGSIDQATSIRMTPSSCLIVREGAILSGVQILLDGYLEIGACSRLSDCFLTVRFGATVALGEHLVMGRGALIDSCYQVKIGSFVALSYDVLIYDHISHSRDPLARRQVIKQSYPLGILETCLPDGKQVEFGSDSWIGRGSVILPGTSIGQGSIIGMQTVVKRGSYAADSTIINQRDMIVRPIRPR